MKKSKPQTKPLSKSKLMQGVQCEKRLWLHLNKPELEAATDAATQFQFDEGNEVGELAREHFGKGLLIDEEYWAYEKAHDVTQEAIKQGEKTIFEASFLTGGFYARADILNKDKRGWHLIEVKKSTKVKDYQIQDATVQKIIIEATGLKLASVSIMHLNNECVFPDLKNLFTITDITDQVQELESEVQKLMPKLRRMADSKTEPKIEIGPHCADPFECPFRANCWRKFPEKSVFDLPGINADRKWELVEEGLPAIKDLEASDFKGATKRAIEVTQSGKTFVDTAPIAKVLKNWEWPLYFFDFETLGSAIPRFDGVKPYGAIPFQFSCHVWMSPKSKELTHFEYLHKEESDPRLLLSEAMVRGLGSTGSIVAYHKSFEIGVIQKLAEFDKKNRKALLALVDRFVDPLPIFRAHVYHPEFLGSFSIKTVAPALIGSKLSYDKMEIGDGSAAQAWAEQIMRGKLVGGERDRIVELLLAYCRQDTLAMVELVKWLMARGS